MSYVVKRGYYYRYREKVVEGALEALRRKTRSGEGGAEGGTGATERDHYQPGRRDRELWYNLAREEKVHVSP